MEETDRPGAVPDTPGYTISVPGNTPLGALIKTTLVDFPGRAAAALFLHRCNLRCPYCYNTDLVTGTFDSYEPVTADEVFAHLEKRKNVLSGFVISGGEPFIFPALEYLIGRARAMDYHIKLDTNGTLPERLEKICRNPQFAPDFLAIDFKTAPERYAELGGNGCAAEDLICSLAFLAVPGNTVPKEYRTVLVPGLVSKAEILKMAEYLPQDANWKFAPFKPGTCLNPAFNNITPYTTPQMEELVSYARSLIPGAEMR